MPLVSISSGTELHRFLRSANVVVLLFSASWCVACRPVKAEVLRRSADSGDTTTYIIIDVDEHPDIATSYNIRKLPTLLQCRANEAAVPFAFSN